MAVEFQNVFANGTRTDVFIVRASSINTSVLNKCYIYNIRNMANSMHCDILVSKFIFTIKLTGLARKLTIYDVIGKKKM